MLLMQVIATLLLLTVLGRFAWVWLHYRGDRVITCPENRCSAGVTVDAAHAAETGITHTPELRLSHCSRWPEKSGCGQECLSQIAAAPEDCLVRNILAKWYHGRHCALCGLPIPDIHVAAAQPAVLGPDGISMEWAVIPVDKLNTVLAASKPLCFACHAANTLVRERPELVVARTSRSSQ